MITKNYKMVIASILETAGSAASNGYIPIKATDGGNRYLGYRISFPSTVQSYINPSSNLSAAGIYAGSGGTPATEDDYKLDSIISSGLVGSGTHVRGLDSNGDPYLLYTLTFTNTTNTDIVIREMGYVQGVYASTTQGAATSGTTFVLLDRTVLSAPVTVPANDSAVIKYTLKTVIS